MANGDAALAAGIPIVSGDADRRMGYDEINRALDLIAGMPATYESRGATPPANPVAGQRWLSTALGDARVSPHPGDRRAVIVATQAWENNAIQEAVVWFYAGKYRMLYNGGWSTSRLGYAECTGDPTNPANWVKPGTTPVFGGGSGGYAGPVQHHGIYIDGTTLYLLYQHTDTNLHMASAPLSSSAPTFTDLGVVFTLPTDAGGVIANCFIVREGNTHFLFYESNTSGWQIGLATSNLVTGPYTRQRSATWSLVQPNITHSASNPFIVKEGGSFVMYYHGGGQPGNGALPTRMYRARCTVANLGNDAWTIDNDGVPMARRAHPFEVDQIADVGAVMGNPAAASQVLFWSAVDNTAHNARIMAASLLPTVFVYTGTTWIRENNPEVPNHDVGRPGLPAVAMLTANTTVTTTGAFTDVLSVVFVPSGTRAIVSHAGHAVNPSGNVTYLQIKSVDPWGATVIKPVGQEFHASGNPSATASTIIFDGLTPGRYYTFTLGVKVGGGSWTCRVVSFPAQEQMAIKAEDGLLWLEQAHT